MTPRMSRKVAIVTGGNRGLGLDTARKLAAWGARVTLTARNPDDGSRACDSIRARVPGADVQSMLLDLASFASIRDFAARFVELDLPLDLLVENAGSMMEGPKPRFTKEGFEATFGTNHLGHFLLTHLLLPAVQRASPSRIVIVASSMHKAGVGRGPGPDFDYDNLRAEKGFEPTIAYRNSKLANVWFTYELNRFLDGTNVTANAVCPGFVPATIADRQRSPIARFVFRHVLARMPFARSLDQGSGNTFFAATDSGLEGIGGKFIVDKQLSASSEESYDLQKARRLWETSRELCGIDQFGQPS